VTRYPEDVLAYLETLTDIGRVYAVRILDIVAEAIPESLVTITYNMPTFQLHGKSFLYFAIWKKHVGFYSVYRGDAGFEALVESYRTHKDSVQFPLARPLPEAIVASIALHKAEADSAST
jgi:uncharacterized protein YdhG (YjbR/CyaY superfamily)